MHERTAGDKRTLLAKRLETRQKVPYWSRVAVKVANECEFESARHAAARTLTLFLGQDTDMTTATVTGELKALCCGTV